jgi:SecD/SecF fusion protein
VQKISLGQHNPFIEEVIIDWSNDKFLLKLYPDFQKSRSVENGLLKDQIDQLLYNEIARLSSQSGEIVKPFQEQFEIALSGLQDSQSFLALRLFTVAQAEVQKLVQSLNLNWNPTHPDLKRDAFPIWDYDTYQALPENQKKLGLVIFAPSMYNKMPPKGLKNEFNLCDC